MGAVNAILDRIDELPALPGSGAALIGALADPEPNLDAVHDIVRRDEAISLSVLRVANSAMYGRPGRTFDLADSVRRLGTRTLLRIALQQQAVAALEGAGSAYGLHREDAWRGAIFGALAAELIATDTELVAPGLAFTAAMLRDCGKLLLDCVLEPDDVARVELTNASEETCFLELERTEFGADHAELGAALCRRWGLPDVLADAIAGHHEPAPPDDPRHSDLHDVVHAADTLCLWSGIATGHDGLRYPLAEHVQQRIMRNTGRAEMWMAETWSRFQELEQAVGASAGHSDDDTKEVA